MTDYISREDAVKTIIRMCAPICDATNDLVAEINALPSAEAVQIHNDGTLEIKVPNAHKVGRVLVMDTDSHIGGGLFYPDDAVQGFRGGKIPPKEMLDGTVLIPKHQWLEMERELAELKEEFESADAVHGEWILVKGSNGKDYHKCPKCLHIQEITGVKNYCAVCGARMLREDGEV